MTSTRFIYLAPTFEDVGVWTGADWSEYPGRIVAGVLSEILQGLGCKVDPIYSEGMKGWEFGFSYKGCNFWSRVGAIEDFLIVLAASGWWDLFGRKERALSELADELAAALERDPRFSNIRWYTKEQMDAGEWDEPSMAGDEPQ